MRGRELYGHYHRLIDELARSATSESGWREALRAQTDRFDADAASLDAASARLLCEELCAQFEHEAMRSTRPLAREILLAAVKWFERTR